MKKITLLLTAALGCAQMALGQANILVKAPPGNNATTQVRAPNGNSSHTTMRGVFLVTAAELSPYMLPGTNISTFGFTLSSGISGSPVNGNFTVYFQHTNDNSYLKGTSFSNAIVGMSNVYAGTMTIPVSASSTSISLTLTSPFTYTGGGLYVAYDWTSSGPFSSTVATYMADNSILVGGASNSTSVTPASDNMGTTSFRPVFLFGAANTATNDVQVLAIEAQGSVPGVLNAGHTIRATVKNGSNQSLSNFPVYLTVTGANPYTSSVTVGTLASGASSVVSFPPFNPQLAGVNTLSVHVDPDQLPGNNSRTYMQTVTCNLTGQNPQPATYTSGVGFNTGSGIIGARLVPPVNATLTGIRLAISTDAGTNGKPIYAALLNSSGTILATTNTITMTSAQLGTYQTFTFATQQNLTAGTTYFLGMAQQAGTAAFPIGSTPAAQILPSNLYVTTFTTGGAPTTLTTNLGYFGIEGVLRHNTSITASSATTQVCAGSTVNLSASGASTYTWSNGMTGASIAATATAPVQTFTVIGSTAVGCTATANTSVSTIPSPTVSATASPSIMCSGQTATLSASGADTYTWSNSAQGPSASVSPTATTVYTVQGTDSNSGCTSAMNVQVTIDTPALAIAGPTAVCQGNSATLTASGAASYTWSTGSNSSTVSLSPTATSSYTLEGTSGTGCLGSIVQTLAVNPNPTVTVVSSHSVLCTGSSATLTASGGSAYSWSGLMSSAPSVVVSPTVTTSFTVSTTNSFSCSASAVITQSVDACTGLRELGSAEARVYPNPSNGVFIISGFKAGSLYTLTDLAGKTILAGVLASDMQIDLSRHPNGVYLLRTEGAGRPVKLIKE